MFVKAIFLLTEKITQNPKSDFKSTPQRIYILFRRIKLIVR